jgi:hypothetical protein
LPTELPDRALFRASAHAVVGGHQTFNISRGAAADPECTHMMRLPRRQFLQLATGAAALPAVSRIARAQIYPTRPVRIVVSLPVGSTPDIVARIIAEQLTRMWG